MTLSNFTHLNFSSLIYLSMIAGLTTLTISTSLLSFTPIAKASHCRAIAHDRDGSAAVRSQPQNNILNLITSIPNGTPLDVIGRRGRWLKVYAPDNHWNKNLQTGWIEEKETRRTCSRNDSSWYSDYSLPPLSPLPPLSSPSFDWEYDY